MNKIPSDWQATELTELEVPAIPAQVATQSPWPSHWPGMHSPMIMRAVMETGEVNGKQVIDPRTSNMPMKLNMVRNQKDMQMCNGTELPDFEDYES